MTSNNRLVEDGEFLFPKLVFMFVLTTLDVGVGSINNGGDIILEVCKDLAELTLCSDLVSKLDSILEGSKLFVLTFAA